MIAEIRKMIKTEIRRELNIILNGSVGQNNSTLIEDIDQMYPGMPTLTNRPVVHPYGFVSRAVTGLLSLVARNGFDPGARYVIGHRDKNRPIDLKQGEAAIYSSTFYEVRVANDHLSLGKSTDGSDGGFASQSTIRIDANTVQINHSSGASFLIGSDGSLTITGKTKITLAGSEVDLGGSGSHAVLGEALLNWLSSHQHTSGAPGSPTSPPIVAPPQSLLSQIVKLG